MEPEWTDLLDELRDLVIIRRASASRTEPLTLFLERLEKELSECYELLAFARNHANYSQSQQWRDWAHRLDHLIPDVGPYL